MFMYVRFVVMMYTFIILMMCMISDNYAFIVISQSHQSSHHHLKLVKVMLLLTPQLTPLLLHSWLMWRWWVDYRIWKATSQA